MTKTNDLINSTVEYLIFHIDGEREGIQVMYAEETLWLTQEAIANLFDKGRSTITEHLSNIFETGELSEEAVCRKFRRTAPDGKSYLTKFYNLDAVISVGYRVNSIRATQFRQWCTKVLSSFTLRGYVLDRKRLQNGSSVTKDYFEHLLSEIREIRMSERRFYQKLTDIYSTSIDYSKDAPTTQLFFKRMQNKMHFAVHQHTAAELIVNRADAEKEHMGLTTWEKAPDGKIVKKDVVIAKNYLSKPELEEMGRLVSATLDLAENLAKRHIPMTMEDWSKRIDTILQAGDNPVLKSPGSVSSKDAQLFAESEFEKFRVKQDKLYRSDFDRYNLKLITDELKEEE